MHHVGELDQRVQLQRKTMARDGAGGATETWTTYATAWAKVRPMAGRERENANRTEAVADYLVVMRNRTDVRESDRMVWRDRHLNIAFIRDRGPRAQFAEFECTKGRST